VLNAGPVVWLRLHVGIVEQKVSPIMAVYGAPHVDPIVVVIET
jgi:hypothetical protein